MPERDVEVVNTDADESARAEADKPKKAARRRARSRGARRTDRLDEEPQSLVDRAADRIEALVDVIAPYPMQGG